MISKQKPKEPGQDRFCEWVLLLLLYAYILIISAFMKECYTIIDFSYSITSGLFLAGLIIYYTAKILLKTGKMKLIFGFGLICCFFMLLLFETEWFLSNLPKIYYDDLLALQESIYASEETYFKQFLPVLIVVIPLSTIIIQWLNNKGWGSVTVLIMIAVIMSFWLGGLDNYLKGYAFYFSFIIVMYYSFIGYHNLRKKAPQFGLNNLLTHKDIVRYSFSRALLIAAAGYLSLAMLGNETIDSYFTGSEYVVYEKNQYYNFTFAGLAKDKKLGGKIFLTDELAFKVQSDKLYYLRGSVKDYYNGEIWQKRAADYNFFIHITPPKNFAGKSVPETVTIYPEKLKANIAFAPLYTEHVYLEGEIIEYDQDRTFVTMGKTIIQSPYTLTIAYPKSKISQKVSYKKKRKKRKKKRKTRRQKYKRYLQIPKLIKPRIHALVKTITKNSRNNAAKIQAIKRYLSMNYPYSLDVSDVPDNEEFLDYFLFTEKKGYCSYFATATVIFARIAGIPARYVEGFRMQDNRDSTDIDLPYVVSNDMAHAWAEVLVSPQGNQWQLVDSVPAAYVQQMSSQMKSASEKAQAKLAKNKKSLTEKKSSGGRSFSSTYAAYLQTAAQVFLVILGLIVSGLVLLFIYKSLRFVKRKKAILTNKSVIPLFEYTSQRLKHIDVIQPVHLSDLEAAANIKDPRLKEQMARIVRVFYDEYFGSRMNRDFDKIEHYDYLESYVRDRQSFYRYYYGLILALS